MTTECQSIPINQPVRFLKSTVTSFNCSLGLGSQESTLNVDLVDDCDPDVVDIAGSFAPLNNGNVEVGAPVYFPDNSDVMPFKFGGVLTNWTIQQSSGGKTYNVKVSDPRQLLENTIVIIDSFIKKPVKGVNYFNVYAHYESDVLAGNCAVFGTSGSNERGMPYVKIIDALQAINPIICSPTGYQFKINFNTFPGKAGNSRPVPPWYRVTGPSISVLQLLTDICEALAYEFYVELIRGGDGSNSIEVGLIDLNAPPPNNLGAIVDAYNGTATDLSYGQELRNEKTKMILFGEQVHYLTKVNEFEHFFGEDFNPVNNALEPVVPYKVDDCGFWIKKRIESLNVSLNKPLANNGPYEISEMDIRCAMGSHEMWKNRTFSPNTKGTLNAAIRANWPELALSIKNMFDNFDNFGNAAAAAEARAKAATDLAISNKLGKAEVKSNDNETVEDLEKIRAFLSNLGSTYYGKQFIAKLKQQICWYREGDEDNTEIHYTDIPTNAGGWVDNGPVIGLNDPDLGFFRQDDARVTCFARFTIPGSGSPDSENYNYNNDDWKEDDYNYDTEASEGDGE